MTTTDPNVIMTLRGYVEHIASLCDGPSMARFVLDHGQEFTVHHPNPRVKPGTIKECFRNAAKLALMDARFHYVEGYACGLIPVHHAWVVDNGGRIVDNTWPEPGDQYFGVAFRKSFLRAKIFNNKSYCLLNNPNDPYELISRSKEKVRRACTVNVGM